MFIRILVQQVIITLGADGLSIFTSSFLSIYFYSLFAFFSSMNPSSLFANFSAFAAKSTAYSAKFLLGLLIAASAITLFIENLASFFISVLSDSCKVSITIFGGLFYSSPILFFSFYFCFKKISSNRSSYFFVNQSLSFFNEIFLLRRSLALSEFFLANDCFSEETVTFGLGGVLGKECRVSSTTLEIFSNSFYSRILTSFSEFSQFSAQKSSWMNSKLISQSQSSQVQRLKLGQQSSEMRKLIEDEATLFLLSPEMISSIFISLPYILQDIRQHDCFRREKHIERLTHKNR